MPRTFPGFEALYQLQDPLLDEPFRGHFNLPFAVIQSIMVGEQIPNEPVPVFRAMGGDLWEVIWGDQIGAVAVAERVVDLLEEQGFSGWATYPVAVSDEEGQLIPGYFGLSVTGRCGPIDYHRGRLIEIDSPIPRYLGLYFDPDSWDGSDLFFADRGRPFVVAEVKEALERAGVRNLTFTPLLAVRTPQIAVDGIPGDKS